MNQPGGHHAHYHHQHEPTAGAAGAVVVQASGSTHADHAGGHDHGAMIADYRRRLWVTLVLTTPVLLLSPMIQHWLGIAETISFPGDGLLPFALSTIVYVYGGLTFLNAFVSALPRQQPGLMTLNALAIPAPYLFPRA